MAELRLGIFCETPLLQGDGAGGRDRVLLREESLGAPMLSESTLRGGLSAALRRVLGQPAVEELGMGSVSIRSGLALLPMRSLQRSYVWVSCPSLLSAMGLEVEALEPEVARGRFGDVLYLEELSFELQGAVSASVIEELSGWMPEPARGRLWDQIALVSEGDFGWLMQQSASFRERVRLDVRGQVRARWREELVAPDSLFWCVLDAASSQPLEAIEELVEQGHPVQFGANRSLGQGWVRLSVR